MYAHDAHERKNKLDKEFFFCCFHWYLCILNVSIHLLHPYYPSICFTPTIKGPCLHRSSLDSSKKGKVFKMAGKWKICHDPSILYDYGSCSCRLKNRVHGNPWLEWSIDFYSRFRLFEKVKCARNEPTSHLFAADSNSRQTDTSKTS